MFFERVLNDGLYEVLHNIRDLPNYSPEKLNEEKSKIIHFNMEYILSIFQEYIKQLPAPGTPLKVQDRVVIYNTRHIFKGISILFDVHITHIYKRYLNWVKYKERQLNLAQQDSAVPVKPKAKRVRKKKPTPVSQVIEICDELPEVREGILDTEKSFIDEVQLSAAANDSEVDRYVRMLSSLGHTSDLPGDLLRFQESVGQDLAHQQDIPARMTDAAQSRLHLTLPDIIRDPHRVSRQLSPRPIEFPSAREPSMVVDVPTGDQLHLREAEDFEKIIENLGEVSVEERLKDVHKRSKYAFQLHTRMAANDYEKFLHRRKELPDPVKFYNRFEDSSMDVRYIQKSMKITEGPALIDCGLHELLKIPKQKIPIPLIPLYLRYQPRIQLDSGRIPEFEFPPVKQVDISLVAQESGVAMEKEFSVLDAARTISGEQSALSHLMESQGARTFLQISQLEEVEDIDGRLSLLMDALSLNPVQGISMPLPPESVPLPTHLDEVNGGIDGRQMESPQIPTNGEICRSVPAYRLASIDDIMLQVIQKCSEKGSNFIRFIDICGLSETKLRAANIFGHLMTLWGKKLLTVHQTSPHPNDIFITLIQLNNDK